MKTRAEKRKVEDDWTDAMIRLGEAQANLKNFEKVAKERCKRMAEDMFKVDCI